MSPVPAIPDELRSIALRQDGLVTRAQALACGMSSNQVDRLGKRDGRGTRVVRGVYTLTTGQLTRRQQIRSVLLYAGDEAALTGLTVLELETFRYAPTDSRVHVLLPMRRKATAQAVMLASRTTRMPSVRTKDGLPLVPIHRAVVDAARCIPDERDVIAVVAEAVQRSLTTLDLVAQELAAGQSAGAARVRRAVRALSRGSASAPENDLLDLLSASSLLPSPQVNYPISADGRRVFADACWPAARLVIEVDSVEHHRFGSDAEATARRRNALTAAGWTVLSVSPQRIRDDPSGVLREIESAYLGCLARQAS
jgi:very-short-patch-repair endonuclease